MFLFHFPFDIVTFPRKNDVLSQLVVDFLRGKRHIPKLRNRRGFRRKKSQQQRQTLEIVEDCALKCSKISHVCCMFFFLFFSSFFHFICFFFLSFFFFSVVRADAKTGKISSISSDCKNDVFFFRENKFLGLGGQGWLVMNGKCEGDPVTATFGVIASCVLPLLTFINVKTPALLFYFERMKKKENKKKTEKKQLIMSCGLFCQIPFFDFFQKSRQNRKRRKRKKN